MTNETQPQKECPIAAYKKMVKKLKTFNLEEETYKKFSDHCKAQGMSMSKKVENFIKQELEKIHLPQKPESQEEKTHPMRKYC